MIITSNTALRFALEVLTSRVAAIEHPRWLAEMASTFPHSIFPVPPASAAALNSYNCFEFAFGLVGAEEVRRIAEYLPSTFCGGAFAHFLVSTVLVPVESATDGDLVLYHDGQQYQHAGVARGDRILSKWGTGQLLLHGLLEVPASYGSATTFYKAPPDRATVSATFLEFARNR